MTRKKKVLLTVLCLFVFSIIGGALYANYWLDNMVAELNSQLVIESIPNTTDNEDYTSLEPNNSQENTENLEKPNALENNIVVTSNPKEDSKDKSTATQENNQLPQISTTDSKNQSTDTSKPVENNNTAPIAPSNAQIAGSVQEQIAKPIEKGDLLEAGLIVISKLSPSEINFLFGFSDNNYTKEELTEVRRVLLSKLNDKDINTLRNLGQKYGKKLEILDPNIPIR